MKRKEEFKMVRGQRQVTMKIGKEKPDKKEISANEAQKGKSNRSNIVERTKNLKKFFGSIFLAERRQERMLRDLDARGTRNGKSMKLYWETLEVKQEDCERRNKKKGRE